VYTGKDRNRRARVDRLDMVNSESKREIGITTGNCLRYRPGRRGLDIADVGKAFRSQQLLGGILRSDADDGILDKANSSGLRRSLSRLNSRRSDASRRRRPATMSSRSGDGSALS